MDIYLSLLSGLVGTLIGGFITWLTTRYTLSRQFKEERNRIISQERRGELIALNSVEKEIGFNVFELCAIRDLMEANNIDFIDFKKTGSNHTLKNDKWNKHSDIIEMIDIDFLGRLQAFYWNLTQEITLQVANKERTNKLISDGFKIRDEIESYVEKYRRDG